MMSSLQLAAILDIADDAIISIDESQKIVLFNKGAERMFGYSAAEAIGQPLELLLPPEARGAHAAHVRGFGASAAAARRMGERSEIAGRRRDGSVFPAEASISRVGEGGARIFTAIVRDTSEAKRQAETLRRAKSEAEAATQAKSMFLANMSHEIRTPLNAMLGMTSLLLHTRLSEEQRDFAQTIRSSGDALLTIINQILDFTKIEQGSLELDRQAFDLRRAIETSLDLVAGAAAEKNLNLAYFVEDSVPPVLVSDGTRLRQILLNLLSNAVKFTRQGEVVVSVDAVPAGERRHEVRFTVRDTGIGIPIEAQEKLFRPFSQVDATTTREFGGTGLGLMISRRLCELLGGRIWVESLPGQGSAFHFTLAADRGEDSDAAYLQANPPLLTGKRILIVDDNTTNRRVLVQHALRWGMVPHAAASPLEALDLVRHGHAIDLAVLDMSMPQMDGAQLARAIRQHRDARALPLVLLTSMGQRMEIAGLQGAGFAAYLHKPLKVSQLYDTLMTLVGGGAPAGPAASPKAEAPLAESLPLRILVAEDNLVNQKVLLRMLEHLGYVADVAATGREALDALERQGYDLVLMDIQMPDMDGLEAMRRIVERHAAERRPWVIAMTANALRGTRERCFAAGMNDYVTKPIDIADLRRVLQRRGGAGSGAARARAPVDEAWVRNLKQVQGGGKPGLLGEVIDLFLTDLPAGIEALEKHAAALEHEALARTAHRLASTALACGAVPVAERCRDLEQAAESGDSSAAAAILVQLRHEYGRAREALAALRAGE
jgi:PAS domain S-box-containing protein